VAVWAGIVVYHWQHMQPQKTEAVDLTYFHKANLWGTYVGYRRFLVNVLLDVVVGIVLWHLKDLLWPPPRPTWWRALLAGPGLAFLFVAFLELSVRHYDSLPHGDYRVDPVLGWSLARRHDVNRFGLRGPEIAAEKAPGEVRILCLGDSCTYGSGTQVSETWPARLQVHLAALLPSAKVTVLNGGVPGYNSAHGVHALRRYLFLKPDLVIWSFTANDAYEMPYQPPSQTDGPLLALLRQRPGREVIPHPKRRETHAHASVLRRVRPRLPFSLLPVMAPTRYPTSVSPNPLPEPETRPLRPVTTACTACRATVLELLGTFAVREVHFCLDSDAPGREATQRFSASCSSVVPKGMDPNAVLVDHGPNASPGTASGWTPPSPPRATVTEWPWQRATATEWP